MKHISKLSQATALVAALGAACLTSLSAHAADNGTLNLKAKVSMTTCNVVIGDNSTNLGTSSYKALNLGNIASDNKSAAKGQRFGTQKQIMFSLKDPSNPNAACNLTNLSNGWQVRTNLASEQLINLSSNNTPIYYLKNAVVGGTDAAVALGEAQKEKTLKVGDNVLISGGKQNASGFIWAQFVYSTTKQATPGKYNFVMPVTITYN